MQATLVLTRREIIRFVRQPMRLLSSLAQPFFFWIFLGTGFSEVFVIDGSGMDYMEFAYPGIVLMLMLFSSIFSTITLVLKLMIDLITQSYFRETLEIEGRKFILL